MPHDQKPRLTTFFHFFFFNDTATTEIYTLSLHDALPIYPRSAGPVRCSHGLQGIWQLRRGRARRSHPQEADRKSTRLNSSHSQISYAVFCLKKKKPDPSQSWRDAQGYYVMKRNAR